MPIGKNVVSRIRSYLLKRWRRKRIGGGERGREGCAGVGRGGYNEGS